MQTTLTRRYQFAASHRLHIPQLSEDDNYALYGKCNNPFGHGHNYVLHVSVRGPVEPESGKMCTTEALDSLVQAAVLRDFSYRNLNCDVTDFQAAVPTTENIAAVIASRLEARWDQFLPSKVRLHAVGIDETERNSFALVFDKSDGRSVLHSEEESISVHG